MASSKLILTDYLLPTACYQIAACPLRADALGAARPRVTLDNQVACTPPLWLAPRACRLQPSHGGVPAPALRPKPKPKP